MLARSVRNPLVIGLGTGIVLIIGAAPPVLAAGSPTPLESTSASTGSDSPSPSGSKSPTPTPTPSPDAKLSLQFQQVPSVVQPGKSYAMQINVKTSVTTAQKAILTVWSTRATVTCDITGKGVYDLGNVSRSRLVAMTVAVPSSVTSGTVVVNAHIDAYNADKQDTYKSLTVKKPKASPSNSSGSGSHSGLSGSSGSSTSHSNPAPMGNLTSGTNNQAPSVAPANGATLPGIGGQNPGQTPSTAPLLENAGSSQSMQGASGPDELTFDKLASTQAAWLAALLVAFSLLLTQVRLGKANVRAAQKATAKPKGAHRRMRRRRSAGTRAL